jgi:hypothetical protein
MSTNKNYLAKTNKYLQKYKNFRGGLNYIMQLSANVIPLFPPDLIKNDASLGQHLNFITLADCTTIKGIINTNNLVIFNPRSNVIETIDNIIQDNDPNISTIPKRIYRSLDEIPHIFNLNNIKLGFITKPIYLCDPETTIVEGLNVPTNVYQQIDTVFDTGNGSTTLISNSCCDNLGLIKRDILMTNNQISLFNEIINILSLLYPGYSDIIKGYCIQPIAQAVQEKSKFSSYDLMAEKIFSEQRNAIYPPTSFRNIYQLLEHINERYPLNVLIRDPNPINSIFEYLGGNIARGIGTGDPEFEQCSIVIKIGELKFHLDAVVHDVGRLDLLVSNDDINSLGFCGVIVGYPPTGVQSPHDIRAGAGAGGIRYICDSKYTKVFKDGTEVPINTTFDTGNAAITLITPEACDKLGLTKIDYLLNDASLAIYNQFMTDVSKPNLEPGQHTYEYIYNSLEKTINSLDSASLEHVRVRFVNQIKLLQIKSMLRQIPGFHVFLELPDAQLLQTIGPLIPDSYGSMIGATPEETERFKNDLLIIQFKSCGGKIMSGIGVGSPIFKYTNITISIAGQSITFDNIGIHTFDGLDLLVSNNDIKTKLVPRGISTGFTPKGTKKNIGIKECNNKLKLNNQLHGLFSKIVKNPYLDSRIKGKYEAQIRLLNEEIQKDRAILSSFLEANLEPYDLTIPYDIPNPETLGLAFLSPAEENRRLRLKALEAREAAAKARQAAAGGGGGQ